MELVQMKEALYEGGVVGAGGAGFPTYAKLSDKAQTVILNCAECEPLIKVDRQLIMAHAEEILSGMQMLVDTMGAEEGILAVKKSYTAAIEAVQSRIGGYPKLRLHILPDIYPAGDEVVLIYETTGKIVPQGKIPILVGCVVVNVETVLNLYNKVTSDKDVTSKFVTVAGLVNNPLTVEVPVGITVQELIDLAGGVSTQDYAILMGGPMTGRICSAHDIVTKTTKAILILPPDCPPIAKRRRESRLDIRNAMSVCSQCSMCTSLCPRNLLGQSIKPHEFMRSIANGLTDNVEPYLNTFFCCSCGLCEMYSCHQDLSPRRLMDEYKGKMRAKGIKIPDKAGKGVASPLREERRVPEHRLVHRLGLHQFDVPAPLVKCEKEFKEVKLMLRQNIGAPCVPEVKVGDSVTQGQTVARPPKEALGTCLHASIGGKVTAVTDQFITIKA
ncbi:SLBB domain-containing protein [Diplocloster modestus]|uniref:SLBB domain-containing protein n=1 Tax=Diplocloster modestus TaxID=2850322 RepID=A0ABS6K8Y7_9FIRM|nr:SLBB domain-containing protein [Diplocloster modestus]MBU9726958.1 SLBB domain-containing protein [Diplocloster modestus]